VFSRAAGRVDIYSMSKRKAAAESESQPLEASTGGMPSVWVKGLLSVLIAWHVGAVIVAPLRFACNSGRPPSPFMTALYAPFRPYVELLYLNHGYFFFAPNPGPSHLVEYKVEFDDGRPPVTGRFPDLASERPRLLYHRHFMLAEALNNRFVPPEPPPEPTPPPLTASGAEKSQFQAVRALFREQLVMRDHARRQYEAMRKSFEEHLKFAYSGSHVELTRVEHRLLTPEDVEFGGRKLNDPETYVNLPESNEGGSR
jgi:hypothetical protein